MSHISSSSSKAADGKTKVKRGRKLTETKKFLFESQEKIEQLQVLIKPGNSLTAKERQKIRNQISAQRSRMSKRAETMDLGDQVSHFRSQYNELIKTLNKHMKCNCRVDVANDLLSKMPDTTAFEILPEFQERVMSAPTSKAPKLTRKGSRGAAGTKRAGAAVNRANQLEKILQTFIDGFE